MALESVVSRLKSTPKATPTLTSSAKPCLSVTLEYSTLLTVAFVYIRFWKGSPATSRSGRYVSGETAPSPVAWAANHWFTRSRWAAVFTSRDAVVTVRLLAEPDWEALPPRSGWPELTDPVALPSRVVTRATLTISPLSLRVMARLEPWTPLSSPANGPSAALPSTKVSPVVVQVVFPESASLIWVHFWLPPNLIPASASFRFGTPDC